MSKPSQMNVLINRSHQYRCFCLFNELVNPKHIYICNHCIEIFSSQNIVEKPKGKDLLGRPRYRWHDIKMDSMGGHDMILPSLE